MNTICKALAFLTNFHLQCFLIDIENDRSEYGNLMLKQLVLVMVECVVQPVESIARLGCACLRYIYIY